MHGSDAEIIHVQPTAALSRPVPSTHSHFPAVRRGAGAHRTAALAGQQLRT